MKQTIYLKKIFILLSFLILYGINGHAQNTYLSFTDGLKESTEEQKQTVPSRVVEDNHENGVEIDFKFEGADISTTQVKGETYNFMHIEGVHKMGQVGAPALPAKNEIIAVPKGAKAKVVITEANYNEYKGYNIHPKLKPAKDTKGAPDPEFQKDDAIYSKDEFFPEKVVEIINVGLNRGTGLAKTQIRPVQFNPVTNTIRVYTNIEFRIEFVGGVGNFDYIAKDNSRHFTDLLKRKVINSDAIPDGISDEEKETKTKDTKSNGTKSNSAKSTAKNYIIITHSQYLTQANDLAQWKRQLGYSVEVVSKSSWSASEVKSEISTRYDSWTPKPDYFVIIGDHDGSYAVPGEIHQDSDGDDFATDLYYACMDGSSDWHPDMAHGRISVSSTSEAQVVVDKIINYEKTPPTSSSFYQNGLNCAQYQDDDDNGYADRRFCHTSEEIHNYLEGQQGYTAERAYYTNSDADVSNLHYNDGYYSNGGLLPSNLRDASFNWDAGSSEITSAIDNGKFYVFHRDHGYVGGSGWAHPYYTTSSMTSLSNGDLLPVVFSINCHTGAYKQNNCFSEKFMRMSGKGAVGVVAASYTSYSGYNDAISIGMMDAIWSDPGIYPDFGSGGTGNNYTIGSGNSIYTLGNVVNQGLYAMEQNWGGSSDQYQYELFHYFGDPAMKIWTDNPNDNPITAKHSSSIHCGSNTFSITGSEPGATATLVHSTQGTMLGQVTLDSNGDGDISYSLSTSADVILTISKHNNKVYETTLNYCCGAVSSFPYTQNFDSWSTSSPEYNCTDDGTVNLDDCWENKISDDIDWDVHTGSTGSSSTGPSSDHTGNGNYLYTESSSCYDHTGNIITPEFDLTSLNAADLTFQYHMYGSSMGELSVEVSKDGGNNWTQLWSKSGDQGDSWHQAVISLNSYVNSSNLLIRFSGKTGSSYKSDMAIDDIEIKEVPCEVVTTFPYTQNFDSWSTSSPSFDCTNNGTVNLGDCWENLSSDDIDWDVLTGSTGSSSTGPSSDHTGSGNYLYTEASSCYDHSGDITTPEFDLTSLDAANLTFWYHMYGSSMGELSVQVSVDGGNSWTNLWSKSGDQGDSWHQAVISLNSYVNSANLLIRFNSTTGSSYTSDIAIDDIEVKEPCYISTFPYTQDFDSWTTSSPEYNCTSDSTVNLEDCWENYSSDDIDWDVYSGSTGSSSTGPSSDHTGSGNYLYTESSSCYDHTGYIITPQMDLTSLSTADLTFWYHMYGSSMGELSVQVSKNLGGSWTSLWSKSGDQGDTWHQTVISLDSYVNCSHLLIRFTGITGSSFKSDMAVDDITIKDDVKGSTYTQIQDAEKQAVDIYSNDDVIYLKNNGLEGQVMVYDMLGKKILGKNIENEETLNKIKMQEYTGYFLVKFVTNESVHSQKVFIK